MLHLGVVCNLILPLWTTPEAPADQGNRNAPGDAPELKRRVLVLPTRAPGMAEGIGSIVNAQIDAALAAFHRVLAVDPSELEELLELEAGRRRLGCEEDSTCLAKLSQAAGARWVLSSLVGQVGKQLVVSMSLMDGDTATAVGRRAETIDDLDQLPARLPELLASILGEQPGDAAAEQRLVDGKGLSFAVFDLKAAGIADAVAKNLTQILSTQIGRIAGSTVITGDDVDSMLQLAEVKEKMGCEDSMACLAEIGGALGVQKLVVGQVGKISNRVILSLRLVDVREAQIDNRVTESFTAGEDQLVPAVRFACFKLLGLPAEEPGTLAVASAQGGVRIQLDGADHGVLPRPPIAGVLPGLHAVRLTKDGYYDWTSDVYVEPGATNALWSELQARPAKWPFWSSATATGVAGLLGVTFGALMNHYDNRYTELAATEKIGQRESARRNALAFATAANGTFIAAGALAVTTGVVAYFTDWTD